MKKTQLSSASLLKLIPSLYPDARSELDFKNSYELLVAVILSAQCTDKRVNLVTPQLFERWPDFEPLSKATPDQVAEVIKSVNYYASKARHLVEMANQVCKQFNGTLPQQHTDLITLAGVGQKTANVVVSELGIEPAIAVDTHVFRVSKRLGLSRGKSPAKVEEDLKHLFPQRDWRALHHSLILHGRRTCTARAPRCNECTLNPHCPSRNNP
jgi:endonuclease-3